MKITKAEFIKGDIGDDYSLNEDKPKIAFLGRSNVGKSSVINALTGVRDLVRTSKLPGKTRQANFFLLNNSFYAIDFPGYGYAKRSVKERNKIIKRIFWYIESCPARPQVVFLIIDTKIGLTVLDQEMLKTLIENKHHIIIIANKIDKMGKTIAAAKVSSIREELPGILVMPFSAKTNEGKEGIMEEITKLTTQCK